MSVGMEWGDVRLLFTEPIKLSRQRTVSPAAVSVAYNSSPSAVILVPVNLPLVMNELHSLQF